MLTAKTTDVNTSLYFLHSVKELHPILFMLEEIYGVRLSPQLN